MRGFRCRLAWVLLAVCTVSVQGGLVDFEEFGLPPYSLGPESYYNGADGAGGFTSGGASFSNSFIDFGGGFTAWRGWAVSNVTDVVTPGYVNQYSAYAPPAGGGAGSALFGVAYAFSADDAYIDLPPGAVLQSVGVTNTTYAALTIRDGDAFTERFGGVSGNDPDYFKLIIRGRDAAGALIGTVEFYLADYRFSNNALDYIVHQWTTLDLSPIATARRLAITFESSDMGPFGINTPTYAAFDDLIWTPEPGALAVLLTVAALQRRRA